MAGVEVIVTTKTGNAGVVVAPSLTYSVLFQAKASVASLEAQANIRWYKADGALSAVTPLSSGTYTALSNTAWTAVLLNAATSPSDAAFAAVEIRWRHTVTTVVGQYVNIDNIVISRSTQAAWGPGGASTNIKFVIERSLDGVSWEPVWGQNYDIPVPARSQSDTRVIIRDRAVQLNNAFLRYRCYAIGYDASNNPVYSLPTVVATGSVPPVLAKTGFIRYPDNPFWDGQFWVDSYSRTYNIGGETYAPQGSDYGIVQYDTGPQVETIEYTAFAIGTTPLNNLINLLMMKRTIFVQLAINSVRYIRPVGDATVVQVRASPLSTDIAAVRTVHKVSFRAITLQPPTYVSRLVTV
jgi:hypothetical protein